MLCSVDTGLLFICTTNSSRDLCLFWEYTHNVSNTDDVIQRVQNTDLFHVFKHLCIENQDSIEYVTVAPLYSAVVYGRPCDDTSTIWPTVLNHVRSNEIIFHAIIRSNSGWQISQLNSPLKK